MRKEEMRTPCYVIHVKQFDNNCLDIEESFRAAWGNNLICGYSVKTNRNSTLIKTAQKRGWLAEVVSEDEFAYAASLGFQKGQMICNGPVKRNMLQKAIDQKHYLNLDCLQEVEDVCHLLEYKKVSSDDLLIGLRVNFDLESLCPGETTAGQAVPRFGINYENGDIKKAVDILNKAHIRVLGLHMHTSTRSRSTAVFRALSQMACQLAEELNLDLGYIDMGGGFFGGQIVKGKPRIHEYAQTIAVELKKKFDPVQVTLVLEPGAAVLATSVDYVTRVENIREVMGEKIITLDGTILHINPFMVDRKPTYDVEGVGKNQIKIQHLCGCTCMEKDRFDILYNKRELLPGSTLVFHNAGAYTMSFNSHFIIEPPAVYIFDYGNKN